MSTVAMPTPESLRAEVAKPRVMPAGEVAFALIPAPACTMLADAMEIADSCARADIESFCDGTFEPRWYDTASSGRGEDRDRAAFQTKAVTLAVRYLNARGLIEKDSVRPGWVRFKEPPR